jgi:4-hydroxybenzoate polyprenyltransferase
LNLALALRLGRISNLPTVWSNVLVGALLAGGGLGDARLPLLLLACSAFYVGGMFLNDAFDREFDARHRPERLALGMAGVALASFATASAWQAMGSSAALAGAIVLYDAYHKANPLSPLLMGLCRVLVVLTAAWCFTPAPPPAVYLAAFALLCHLIGLTYIAKQEHLDRIDALWPLGFLAVPLAYGAVLAMSAPAAGLVWFLYAAATAFALLRLRRRAPGDVPRAVVVLIAGMSLLDGAMLAASGFILAAALAVAAFAHTLALQRWVAGT